MALAWLEFANGKRRCSNRDEIFMEESAMRTLLNCAVVLGLAGLLALAPRIDAAPPAKVKIAHLAEVEDIFEEETDILLETYYKYVVIEISEKALNGHGRHDDVLDGEALIDGTIFVANDYSRGSKIEIFVPAGE